jgi:hypothetical protein
MIIKTLGSCVCRDGKRSQGPAITGAGEHLPIGAVRRSRYPRPVAQHGVSTPIRPPLVTSRLLASALEEGVWGRNLLKVSPQLAQPQRLKTRHPIKPNECGKTGQ